MGRPGKPGGKAERDGLRAKMVAQGCSVDEVAEEFRAHWRFPPLAAYRYAAGLTQLQAACRYNEVVSDAAAGVDNSLISKLELWPAGPGGKAPTAYNLTVLAVVYGTTPHQLVAPADRDKLPRRDQLVLRATYPQPTTSNDMTTTPTPTAHRAIGDTAPFVSPPPEVPRWADTRPIPENPLWHSRPHSTHPGGTWSSPFGSAAPLPQPGTIFDGDRVSAAGQQSQEFATWAEVCNVGPVGLDLLARELTRLARDYVHAPPEPVFHNLVVVRDQIIGLLHGRQRPAYTRRLFELAGTACVLLAHASDDLGHTQDGLAQVQSAWACAEQAGDPALKAWALATEALIREYHGEVSHALNLARQGQQYAAEMPVPGTVGVWLAALEARSAARLGRSVDARAALTRSQHARDAANGSKETPALDVMGGLFTFVPAKQAFYAGATMLRLGDARHAETAAQRAIDAYVDGPAEQRSYGDESLARLDLASARLQRGELDGTAEVLDGVLALPPELRINVLGEGIQHITDELASGPHRTARTAIQLRQALLDCQTSARPELTST